MRHNLRQFALAIVAGLTFVSVLAAAFHIAGIRLNTTAPLPIGFYIRTRAEQRYAEFCPQGGAGVMSSVRGYRSAGNCRMAIGRYLSRLSAEPATSLRCPRMGSQ